MFSYSQLIFFAEMQWPSYCVRIRHTLHWTVRPIKRFSSPTASMWWFILFFASFLAVVICFLSQKLIFPLDIAISNGCTKSYFAQRQSRPHAHCQPRLTVQYCAATHCTTLCSVGNGKPTKLQLVQSMATDAEKYFDDYQAGGIKINTQAFHLTGFPIVPL